jgi:hypothetical protein
MPSVLSSFAKEQFRLNIKTQDTKIWDFLVNRLKRLAQQCDHPAILTARHAQKPGLSQRA